VIYNGFGCRDRARVLKNLFYPTSLVSIPGENGNQNVAAIHFGLVLDRFELRHFHANQGAD
jgi:hypothetical protein